MLRTRFLPRKFEYAKRSAWATCAGYGVLPKDQQPQRPLPEHVRSRVRAESVLIGKFDVDAEVRLRAFYPKNGRSEERRVGKEGRSGWARARGRQRESERASRE